MGVGEGRGYVCAQVYSMHCKLVESNTDSPYAISSRWKIVLIQTHPLSLSLSGIIALTEEISTNHAFPILSLADPSSVHFSLISLFIAGCSFVIVIAFLSCLMLLRL